ncbi:hypothetical protein GDO86_016655 [Hymenochirus boettgeri]|uniref:Cholinesterase n=1 Tax=Hymenochirus boettgeri TaxID=247094 RepID=A0A8T2K127_9PIPI|nr:hypothetical protein GDO86_016655 [Hymenochirus boettgeri]
MRYSWGSMMTVSVVCVTMVSLLCLPCRGNDEIVVTKYGKVKGFPISLPYGNVMAFLGIPYAEPPVGDLRFKKPKSPKPWSEVKDATIYGNSCFQLLDKTFSGFPESEMWNPKNELSEDCLNLNIWAPTPKPNKASVMVWIYGGGFETGTSSLDIYDGKFLAATEQVIVVSMNYRLGPLGFLSFPGNPEAPGNVGLFDQRLALQWVYENIAAFGGNPERSQTFFTRAIMQSGTGNAPWASVNSTEARRRALALANLLGCSTRNEIEVIACLRTKNPQDIFVNAYSVVPLSDKALIDLMFPPTVDGDFLVAMPNELMKSEKLKMNTQVLTGVNKDEGSYFLVYGKPGFSIEHENYINRTEFKQIVKTSFPKATQLAVDSILLYYTDWTIEQDPAYYRDAMKAIAGDYYFVCPLLEFTKKNSEIVNNAYLYFFQHRSSRLAWPQWMGVLHGYEIEFVFGMPLNTTLNYTKEEQILSRTMMRYWGNFAKTGDPNDAGSTDKWPIFSVNEQYYRVLDTGTVMTDRKMRINQCNFWSGYYPKVLQVTGT